MSPPSHRLFRHTPRHKRDNSAQGAPPAHPAPNEATAQTIIDTIKEEIEHFEEASDPASAKGKLIAALLTAIERSTDERLRAHLREAIAKLEHSGPVTIQQETAKRLHSLHEREKSALEREAITLADLIRDLDRARESAQAFVKRHGGKTPDEKKELFTPTEGFYWDGQNAKALTAVSEDMHELHLSDVLRLFDSARRAADVDELTLSLHQLITQILRLMRVLLDPAPPKSQALLSLVYIEVLRKEAHIHDELRITLAQPEISKNLNLQVHELTAYLRQLIDAIDRLKGKLQALRKQKLEAARTTEAPRDGESLRVLSPTSRGPEPPGIAVRVLILTHEYRHGGGVATVTAKTADYLNRLGGVSADVLVQPPRSGADKHAPLIFYARGSGKQELANLEEALLYLSQAQYHIIHVHSIRFSPYLFGGLDRIMHANPRAKVIYTCHSVIQHEREVQGRREPWGAQDIAAQEKIMELADRIVHMTVFGALIAHGSPTQLERAGIGRHAGSYAHMREKAVVIPNGIDLDHRLADAGDAIISLQRKLTFRGDIILSYIGRLAEEKGVVVLAKAFREMAAAHPRLRLRVIGDQAPGSDVRTMMMAELHSVQDKVTFTGWLEDEQLAREYDQADIIIIPSFNESFSIAALEAFAHNKVVIISNVDGPRELFIQSPSDDFAEHALALGIDPKRPETIVHAVDYCITHAGDMRAKVSKARAQIREKYNWGQVIKQLSGLYQASLAGRPFESDFKPDAEYVPVLSAASASAIRVGLVYDMEIWTQFIPALKQEGLAVRVWGEGLAYGKPQLEQFISSQDVILLCWLGADPSWITIAHMCKAAGKPLIMKYENGIGMNQDNLKAELRDALKSATILAPTDLLSSEVLARIGIGKDRQILVPNGVDFTSISRIPDDKIGLRQRFNLPAGRMIAAFLGRLDVPKNFLIAMIAYERMLHSNITNTTLLIDGYFADNKDEPLPAGYLNQCTAQEQEELGGSLAHAVHAIALKIAREFGGTIECDSGVTSRFNIRSGAIDGPRGRECLILRLHSSPMAQERFFMHVRAVDCMLMPSGWGVGNVRVCAESMALGTPIMMLDAITHPFAYGTAGIYITAAERHSIYDGLPLYLPSLQATAQALRDTLGNRQFLSQKAREGQAFANSFLDMDVVASQTMVPAIKACKESFDPATGTLREPLPSGIYSRVARAMKPIHGIPPAYLADVRYDEEIHQDTDILFVAFNLDGNGDQTYNNETIFAVLTMLRTHAGNPSFAKRVTIHICTDDPDAMSFIARDFPNVKIRRYTREKMRSIAYDTVKDPAGEARYIYFIKLFILKEVIEERKRNTVLIDTDIIFNHKMHPILNGISASVSFMNEREHELARDPEYMEFARAFNSPKELSARSEMWNSGLVGIHCSNWRLAGEAFELLKRFIAFKYEKFPDRAKYRTLEQLAVAVILQRETTVRESYDLYFHYFEHKDYVHQILSGIIAAIRRAGAKESIFGPESARFFGWYEQGLLPKRNAA